MRFRSSYRYTNVTLTLIIINVGLYLVTLMAPRTLTYLALTPLLVIRAKAFWQVVTYMFVHGGTAHIFLNMLALFLFGTQVERRLGSREFLLLYLATGIGAGAATLAVNWFGGLALVPVVGASGAIYGLLLAYATLFPDAMIFIFGILPLRAPLAVALFAGLELFSQLTNTSSGIAHLTHLAGLIFAYLYLLLRLRIDPIKIFFGRRY